MLTQKIKIWCWSEFGQKFRHQSCKILAKRSIFFAFLLKNRVKGKCMRNGFNTSFQTTPKPTFSTNVKNLLEPLFVRNIENSLLRGFGPKEGLVFKYLKNNFSRNLVKTRLVVYTLSMIIWLFGLRKTNHFFEFKVQHNKYFDRKLKIDFLIETNV